MPCLSDTLRPRLTAVASALAVAFLGAAALAGCASTSPLLVEPRTANPGDVRVQLGAAALVPVAGDRSALPDARKAIATNPGTIPLPSPGGATLPESTVDTGTAVALGAKPGVAPVVRAVVGITRDLEGTFRYGGRDVGAGVRYVFLSRRTETAAAATLSIGVEARTVLMGRPEDGVLTGVSVASLRGYGGTVPLIAAWQSDAGLVLAYAGVALGIDRVTALVQYSGFGANQPTYDASVFRVFGAGTLGIGLGFRRLHVLGELGIQRDLLHATVGERSADVRLWSLTPAFAVSLLF
jgi:hypothetical protein